MRGCTAERARPKFAAQSFVLLLLCSSLLAFVPASSAAIIGNLGIGVGVEPLENATYDRDTSFIIPAVKVYNDQLGTHASREIRWEICAGNYTSNQGCPMGSHDGMGFTGAVQGFTETTITFSNYIYQPTQTGIHTAVFYLAENDFNSSDDRAAYLFDVAAPLRDISINEIEFDESEVYNSNTSYPISVDFYRRSWGSQNASTFGWRLFDNGSVVANESIEIVPPIATDQHWGVSLPDFVAPYPGTFTLEAGLYESDGDMNSWNNLDSIIINVNDSVDVWVENIEQARGNGGSIFVDGQWFLLYPYGEDSIKVTVGNIGYVDVNTTLDLSIFDMNATLLNGPTSCNITMSPGESTDCIFDMPVTGELILNATFSQGLTDFDINPSDNWFEDEVSSRISPASPVIAYPNEGDTFDSGDEILLVGGISQMASRPVNFTWRLNYEELVGYGQVTTTTLPRGEWLLTLTTRDSLGQMETAARTVRIHNRMSLVAEPWVVGGESVMNEDADYTFNAPEYPPEGIVYSQIKDLGHSPLRLFEYQIEATEWGVDDPGITFAESWVDLSGIIPATMDRDSISVWRLPDRNSAILELLEFPNSYEVNEDNDTVRIYDEQFTNGLYIISGDLEAANVSAFNLSSVQGAGGQLTLTWDPEGDLDNPYFGGWRVYRRTNFPFFWPYQNSTQFSSTDGYEIIDLPPYTSAWVDPAPLPDGMCASYLVMAYDRQGITDYSHGAAAGWNGENVEWQCGDASPPIIEVQSMSHEVTFNNSSSANYHEVNVTWIWPSIGNEENVTWTLYRVEVIPGDLRWMDTQATNLWGEEGEEGRFHDFEGPAEWRLKVDRTYYYILVPTDAVGNTDYSPMDGNIEKVTVANQFWDHNSYLIPPPPPEKPPPYGVEWLGDLVDAWQVEAFQTSAVAAFVILLANLVLVPVVINQTRGVRRLIKREKAIMKAEREAMQEEMLADDLSDFFR